MKEKYRTILYGDEDCKVEITYKISDNKQLESVIEDYVKSIACGTMGMLCLRETSLFPNLMKEHYNMLLKHKQIVSRELE